MGCFWIRHTGAGPARRSVRHAALAGLAVASVLLAGPRDAAAQGQELADGCASTANLLAEPCLRAAQALAVVQPRLLLAQSGGNPVPGTASTLGMRIGSMPRWSVAGRLTGVRVGNLPDLDGGGTRSATLLGVNGDVAIGLFRGFTLAPTAGGVLSVDLLGSAGFVFTPADAGFDGGPAFGWAAGARLGILRESFTLPGISLSALYRDLGEVRSRGGTLEGVRWSTDPSALSVRAALSKDVLGFGVAAGGGLDRVRADAVYGGDGTVAARGEVEGLVDSRAMAFASVGWVLLVLQGLVEVGWQEGGEAVPGAPAAMSEGAGDGGWYATLGLRLSI